MKLTFLGSTDEVTGSRYLLETEKARILIDCGLFQSEKCCEANNAEPMGFDASKLDAVFLTHAHADHSGLLPRLVKEGYAGAIYMTEPTIGLTKLILDDSYEIMSEQAEEQGEDVLYSESDLESTYKLFHSANYHEQISVKDATVMFHDAGHILGSAFASVRANGKCIVFSGDIGNANVPILPETERISEADAIVCESTYGHRVHESVEQRNDILQAVIKESVFKNGVLLIPSFSIERTQELLYAINQILKNFKTDVPIYLDSPMAIKATELYRHYQQYLLFDSPILQEPDRDFFSFPNLRETIKKDESKTINEAPKPKIIIAGSGMMNGGRILHHLVRYLQDANSTVLIIGFQAKGTLGRKIYEGAKRVNILGKDLSVRAQIKAIGAFSAHADQAKLTEWLMPESGVHAKQIFLVHGEPDVKQIFQTHLRHNLKSEILIPKFNQTFTI
ncbi:MAG: hypothetical protein ACD_76C00106G0027 [uncultured bacterium]|nr:MAG: hypothetical protein ACD_76C00106G0027 [uncultured bacterium]